MSVSTLMFMSSCGSSRPDLFEDLFEFVLRMDRDPFICPPTESDMTSNISESASPAFF